MKFYTIYETIFPACFFAIAIWLGWIALRGFQSRRPTLFSARISFLFFFLFTLPFLVLCPTIIWFGPRAAGPDLNELGLLLIPAMLWGSWRLSRGLTVVGATPEALDRALSQTAESLKLAYEPASLGLKRNEEESLSVRGRTFLWCRVVQLSSSIDGKTRAAVLADLDQRLSDSSLNLESKAYATQVLAAVALFVAGIALHQLG